MAGLLRIRPPIVRTTRSVANQIEDYIERLVKLIPTEIIGLYLAGKSAILTKFPSPSGQPGEATYWIIWMAFCMVGVLVVRSYMTRDPDQNQPPQWTAVFIAIVSFVIWVYSMGDVFARVFDVWDPLTSTLLVLAWTFIVPIFYRG